MKRILSESFGDLIDEAIFVPDKWIAVLDAICEATGSDSGAMSARFGAAAANGIYGTKRTRQPGQEFWISPLPKQELEQFLRANPIEGFHSNCPILHSKLPSFRDRIGHLQSLNIGPQLNLNITLPSDEILAFTFERRLGGAEYDMERLRELNQLVSHLRRATRIAARLPLGHMSGTVEALRTLGLSAAILNTARKVVSMNDGFSRLISTDIRILNGRLYLANAKAAASLEQALVGHEACSIPLLPGSDDGDQVILHVHPLKASARDLFEAGHTLVIAAPVHRRGPLPDPALLMEMFGLTRAEARLAALLSCGSSLQECAQQLRLGYGTARAYLLRVFAKTQTRQQSELVALLRGVVSLALSNM